ncbi:MAG: hypothetical protein PHW77_05660, partial [Eubacteriales bacterium]|nr:hypothetical protein [Eubacteriales bacterium]
EYYSRVIDRDDASSLPPEIIPTVEDFRTVYRVLKRELANERKRISVRYLKRRIEITEAVIIDLCTLKTAIDVMTEFGLAETVRIRGNDIIEIKLMPNSQKIDLDKSETLKNLRKRTS